MDWAHQTHGVNAIFDAFDRDVKRVCLTSPTGGGKSRIIQRTVERLLGINAHVALYTNRKLLLEQLSSDLVDERIDHGIRAAGHDEDLDLPFQICSMQTEVSRLKRGRPLHACRPGDVAIVDEGHLHTATTARTIRDRHTKSGAYTLDVTATPISMGEVCDELIVAGTMSELRECGALIPAVHYGPDEPDMKRIKGVKEGQDLTEKQVRTAMMTPTLFGRIWDNFERLNPEHKPTICFGPDVEGSMWIAEQFTSKGVRSAHIDGEHIWLDGELHRKTDALWQEVLDESRTGSIVVISNRFVLREGINAPWIAHGIFATIFGAVQSYLQAGGRLLRASAGLDHVTVQDHGGNWHRHGSLNSDRVWSLNDTAQSVAGKRFDRMRAKKEREPFLCPSCQRVWVAGRVCSCGHVLTNVKKSRPVVTADGLLREQRGDIYRPRRISQNPRGIDIWERMYWRSRTAKGRRTFRAAEVMFARENNWSWPDRRWPFMPVHEDDFFREVPDVPMERLTQNAHQPQES